MCGVNEDDVWTYARDLDARGDRKLLTFMMNRRDLPQLLERIAKAEAAPQIALRRSMTRMQLLCDAADKPCTCATPGRWRTAAEEVSTTTHLLLRLDVEVDGALLAHPGLVVGRQHHAGRQAVGLELCLRAAVDAGRHAPVELAVQRDAREGGFGGVGLQRGELHEARAELLFIIEVCLWI